SAVCRRADRVLQGAREEDGARMSRGKGKGGGQGMGHVRGKAAGAAGVLSVFATLVTPAAAQPAGSGSAKIIQVPLDEAAPKVNAGASRSDVRLGARSTLYITATYDPGIEVTLAEPVQLGGDFEVRRRVSSDREEDGKHVREWQLEVYAWELGELQ